MPLFKKIIFFAGIVVSMLYHPCSIYAQSPGLMKGAASRFIMGSLTYLKTDKKDLLITDVNNIYNSGEFKPLNRSVLNAGISSQCYWIHLDIINNSIKSNNLVVDIDNARLNELELYEAANNTIRSLGKLGDFYPFYQRAILHKNFLYQVSLSPGQKKDYFLFVNQVGHAFVLPIKVVDSKKFQSTTFKDYLFDGLTYGLLLFVAVLSLLFFITSRHALYLYYGLYIITTIVWFLSYFGLGYQYLWPNSPSLNTSVSPCMAAMNVLLNLQICQILLRLSQTNRILNRLANYTKLALFLVAVFPIAYNLNAHGYAVNFFYLMIFLCLVLFAMLLVSSLVIYYAFKGFIAAKFYFLASLLKAGSIINLALLELGVTPAFYNMEAVLQVGIFIEITLLTYALATRYTNYKIKTFEKVIEAHENERSLLSKEIHDGISSALTGINYGIKNFTRGINHLPDDKTAQLKRIFDELGKVQLEARNISHNTMPDYIKKSTITDIVEKHVEEIQNKANSNPAGAQCIRINFSANEQLVNFSEAVKLNIFRIIQEVLINILKHSEATNADIIFSFDKKEMIIIAEDNGRGFINSNQEDIKGMGLKNLQSRVELLEGNLFIKSPVHKREPDASLQLLTPAIQYGTMIKIRIPYKNNLFKSTGYDY